MVSNQVENYICSVDSSISDLFSHSRNILGGYMIYNLPLSMILQKLTDIDNKLALLVENQPIDMEKEMRIEEEKEKVEEKKNGRKSKRGANKCM